MQDVGKAFSLIGIVFLLLGLLLNIMPNAPRIPGDIFIDRPNIRIYVPLTSSLVVSLLLTLLFNIFEK